MSDIKERYPYLSDYLDTVFFEQGGTIYDNYTEAFARYVLVTSEDPSLASKAIEAERRKFYEEFETLEKQLDAFAAMGGAARNASTLAIYVPKVD